VRGAVAIFKSSPVYSIISWPSFHRVCKPLAILYFTVIVVSGCAVEFFLFSKGEEIFLIQFCQRWKGGSSLASFGWSVGWCGLQMCLHLCDGYFV
jgi:hypothetical protein